MHMFHNASLVHFTNFESINARECKPLKPSNMEREEGLVLPTNWWSSSHTFCPIFLKKIVLFPGILKGKYLFHISSGEESAQKL